MAPLIKIEYHPNPESMTLHTDVEISQTAIQNFWRPLRSYSDEYLKKVGEKGTQFVKDVLTIPGVKELHISTYEIMLIRATLFAWKDIEPELKRALMVTFGGEERKKYIFLADVLTRSLVRELKRRAFNSLRAIWVKAEKVLSRRKS